MIHFEILELVPYLGIDRNKASGDSPDQMYRAETAYNLAPDRRGAYVPFGRGFQHMIEDVPVTIGGTLIGFDERGFSSFEFLDEDGEGEGGNWRYRLFDGDTVLTSRTNGYTQEAPATHIHGFGAYVSRTRFMGYDDNQLARQVEPFGLTPNFVVDSGSAGEAAPDPASDPLVAVANNPDAQRWMAITVDGATYTTTPLGGAWGATPTKPGDVGAPVQYRTLVYGGGVWVAGGIGGVRYSNDNGATWHEPTTAAVGNGDTWKVLWSGTRFNATIDETGVVSSMWQSVDGDTWTNANTPGSVFSQTHDPWFAGNQEVTASFAFSEAGHGLAIAVNGPTASWPARRCAWISGNGGQTWVQITHQLAGPPVTGMVGGRGYEFWALKSDGSVWFIANGLAPSNQTQVYAGGAVHAKSGWYDTERGRWYLMLEDGTFWDSENGTALRAVPEMDLGAMPLVGDYSPQTVISSPEAVVAVGQVGGVGAIRIVNATFGLGAGTYTVYHVSWVSTESGRLVVDLGHQVFTFEEEFGAGISATAPPIPDIIAANPWMAADTAQAQDMLEDRTFIDVYVSFEPPVEEDSSDIPRVEDSFPVFSFQLRPSYGVPRPRGVRRNTVGRLLGDGDQVMTMAFLGDPSEAVVHGARVWGVAAKEEGLYTLANSSIGEAEAAGIRGGVALIYSDIGYVNLMRQGSYLPVVPSQSDQFVGMVGTPSGILMFFTNEVILVSGDPLLPNGLMVEPYPESIGADPGTRVTKLGGVAFCIWKGDIYALTEGGARSLGRPAWLYEDPFVEVIVEPTHKCLLGRTAGGRYLRYFLEHDMWFDNTMRDGHPILNGEGEGSDELVVMLPNIDIEATRYVSEEGDVYLVLRGDHARATGTLPDMPYITWRRIDYSNKNRVDATYGVIMPVVGSFASPPVARFEILETDDPVDNPGTTSFVLGERTQDTYYFMFPRGRKSRTWDLRINLTGMAWYATLEPQLQVEWVPGHTSGRRQAPVIPT